MQKLLSQDFDKFITDRLARAGELVLADNDYKNAIQDYLRVRDDLITTVGKQNEPAIDDVIEKHIMLEDLTAEYAYRQGFRDALSLIIAE